MMPCVLAHPQISLNCCSSLTSIWNAANEPEYRCSSAFRPASYDQAVIGPSVGNTLMLSGDRKPRDAFPYTETAGVTFIDTPSFGETTPCDAATDSLSTGVRRVRRASKRAPSDTIRRDATGVIDCTNSAPDSCSFVSRSSASIRTRSSSCQFS